MGAIEDLDLMISVKIITINTPLNVTITPTLTETSDLFLHFVHRILVIDEVELLFRRQKRVSELHTGAHSLSS